MITRINCNGNIMIYTAFDKECPTVQINTFLLLHKKVYCRYTHYVKENHDAKISFEFLPFPFFHLSLQCNA